MKYYVLRPRAGTFWAKMPEKNKHRLIFSDRKKVLSVIGSIDSSAKSESLSRLLIASTKEHRPVFSKSAERTAISMYALKWCNDIYKCSRSWQMLDRLVCNQRISQFLSKRWRSQVLTWSHCFCLDVHNLYMLSCIENFSGINLLNLSWTTTCVLALDQ